MLYECAFNHCESSQQGESDAAMRELGWAVLDGRGITGKDIHVCPACVERAISAAAHS